MEALDGVPTESSDEVPTEPSGIVEARVGVVSGVVVVGAAFCLCLKRVDTQSFNVPSAYKRHSYPEGLSSMTLAHYHRTNDMRQQGHHALRVLESPCQF